MKLKKKETLNDLYRYKYSIFGVFDYYCEKIFKNNKLLLNKVVISFSSEDMMPHICKKITNFDEYKIEREKKEIDCVRFYGSINNTEFGIVVDFGLSLMNIVSDYETIKLLENMLKEGDV